MQMLHSITSRQRFPPLLVAAVVFLLAAVVSAGAIWRIAQADSRALRERAAFEATIHAHALERSIERSLSATYAVAALIREGNGAIRNFDTVARQMLPLYPGATSLQLAPRGIVQYIVPLAGNEKAIGHNLLQDPARTKAAIVARDTGKLTLDGPFPLLQGGMGAVGRLPVFLDSAGGPTFWGFTSVVIRFPDVIETARFVGLAELGLAYQLWRTDPVTGQRAIIAASSSAAMIDPVQKIIAVPNAVWTLSVVPVNGWRQDPLKFLFEAALGLFLSALLGYAAKLLIELRAHKRELEARVERRTAEVKARETDLNRAQSIARVGSWVVDLPGHKVQWSAEASRLLGGSTGVPIDRDAFLERVHPEDRAAVDRAWQETLAGKPLDLEHRVGVGTEKTRWVHTRADPEFAADGTLRRIVGTVQDISERKHAETARRDRLDRVQRQMEAVNRISASDALLAGDVERLAREITAETARVTGVERANVWLFNEDETELHCIDLYEATPGMHTAGAILRQEHFENEFRALKNARYINADDPLTDPRTAGYIEDYLKPLRISAMLDTVVQISGKHLGLLCFEHVDRPHHWEQDEITFACQLADKIGLAITIRTRLLAQAELAESERHFRAMVEQSVSGFYLIQDNKFVYVNARFAEIFRYASPGEITGKSPLDLTATKDRATVAENIRRQFAGEVKSIGYSFIGLRKDGSEIEIGMHGSSASHEGRPAIIGLLQDISERKRAEDEIRHYASQLEQAMRGTIGVINAIGEVRDPYTHGHERRVGEIAAAIGAEMGLDTNRVEGIRIAGYMHDVGKIGVPAEILSKPSKLSRLEYELVKSHAERGYEILKSFEFPWPVADIAWQHHERLDGSGYPRGLKGDAILLDARILAIADVVEAMSSHRPYRPGLGIEPALAEISKGAGTLYDPQAVAACLRLFHDKGYRLPE